MTTPSVINLLIVDHEQFHIDHIVKTLSGDGYQVEWRATHQLEEARNTIDYQPLDLIVLRIAGGLPTLAELRLMIAESRQDIPLVAAVDEETRGHYRPARLMEEGADNYFYLVDADHLAVVVRQELRHLQERKREQSFETRFKETENRMKALLENIDEAIAYIHEGVHAYANPGYLRLFGYDDRNELAQIQLIHMVPPNYRDALKSILRRSIRSGKAVEPVELVGLRRNGQTFPILFECAPIRMNDEPCTQVIARDATPDKGLYNQQLEQQIKFDDITGLCSRRYFLETLELNHNGVVLYVLLPDYAAIRYGMGFPAADHFMHEAADLIKGLLASDEIAGHFANAVITIFIPAEASSNPLELAERIRVEIAGHNFQVNGKLFTTTCCIGIYRAKDERDKPIDMLSRADRACEGARKKGGNRIEEYVSPKEERSGRSAISEEEEATLRLIRAALTESRLSLLYQPIVSFKSSEEARYKTYLKLLDESGQAQNMEKLGATAVRYGAMGALDKWTIIRALEVLLEAQKTLSPPPSLFIRLSRNSIADAEFIDWLRQRYKDHPLPNQALVFEIKEDNADESFEDTRKLRGALRGLGCGLALSHFGGKPHSERLLQELTPEYIKLDGSLIERLAKARDETSRQAVAALTEKAQELNIYVVASGVSTAPQMASIWQFGVTLVQGNMVAEAGDELDFDFKQYAG